MDVLLKAVYEDLRMMAGRHLHRESPHHTLQATALVHEVYLKLIDQRKVGWRDRAHFFAAASHLMRRILIDHARARRREKRGQNWGRITIQEVVSHLERDPVDLIALDAALSRLEERNPTQCRLVEMRFFGGMTLQEAAQVLGIGRRSADREWSYAKAWLYRELKDSA
jgi:RNA polymerase sigma-70 factor (ECF subfamily)